MKTGSISLAQTQDRLISLKHVASSLNTVIAIPCEIITPKKVAQLHPLVNIHDLVGLALPTAVSRNGVQIHEQTSVSHVSVQKGCVAAIETDRGQIKCQYFVNCWAYELGHAGEEAVSIPLHACEHFYLPTHPLNEPLASTLPMVVDPDGRIYICNWQGGILSGGFEKNPKPLFTEGQNQLEIRNLQEDWDHFEPLLGALLHRLPDLEALQIMQLVNCPESFTPDMRCIMGESPTVQGYFILAGMNSAGISYGGGAGKEEEGERASGCVVLSYHLEAAKWLQYFFMISPTDQQVHCWAWLKNRLTDNSNLTMEDVTWKCMALNLIGPCAVDVLSELSYAPVTPEHFPSLFCKEMSVGYANGIYVMSITHTGEPGFILYIPIEYALHVYNEVMNVGQKYGIRNASYYVLHSPRIEKFFVFWGQDLDAFTTPMECGHEFQVKLDKGMQFVGQEALLEQKQNSVYKHFTMFILEDHDTDTDLWPWWGEPIFHNVCYVGKATSSAYSYALEHHICLGFVHHFDEKTGEELVVTTDFINQGEYEIDIAGQRFQAKAKLYPFSSFSMHHCCKDEMELSGYQGSSAD
uniref:Pyruvate dehydrogenase phosphatase regulatory subunit n=1 Tax=Strigops habroptila TaxID=2489341 RepID=A0A672UAE6_STRHB